MCKLLKYVTRTSLLRHTGEEPLWFVLVPVMGNIIHEYMKTQKKKGFLYSIESHEGLRQATLLYLTRKSKRKKENSLFFSLEYQSAC